MVTVPQPDHRLHALVRLHAARLSPSRDLRERILSSAPGHALRLEKVIRKSRRMPTSPVLLERIVAAAPAGDLRGFLASLWPFGPVWRPAAGLAALAILGVVLGNSVGGTFRDAVSVNRALSEEVFVLALSFTENSGPEAFGWDE